jgi:leucyl-tRNA synthetase
MCVPAHDDRDFEFAKKVAADIDKDAAIAAGKDAIADKLTGTIVKEIYVPGRIINIVQK